MRTLLLLGVVPALAGSAGPALAEPDARKRELIHELITLSGTEVAEGQIASFSLRQIQQVYPSMLDDLLATETELDAEQKVALREHLGDFDVFASEFQARFPKRVQMDGVLREAYTPLYDETFSTEELEEILRFYRSDTGRKVVEVLPRLQLAGMQRTLPLVQPRVMELVGEILAQRRAELFP